MFLALAGVSDDKCFARDFSRISELRINRRSVLTINLFDTVLRTLDFAARRSVNVARCFGDALVTSNLPNSLRERRHSRKISSKKQGISVNTVLPRSQNPQCPFFHLMCLSRGFFKPRIESPPPCSQAILMADFMLFAKTMNCDGLSSLWLRNVTTYVLATAGGKIAGKPMESKGGFLYLAP